MADVCLYRAISLAESDDISRSVRLRCIEGSLEGKWFAESRPDAAAWGLLLYGSTPFRVVSVLIPGRIAASFFRLRRLDNIGPARFAVSESL
jgi:hypothetical protein